MSGKKSGSVHEDRRTTGADKFDPEVPEGPEKRRITEIGGGGGGRRPRRGPGHGEVAGLEENEHHPTSAIATSAAATCFDKDSGLAIGRQNRRPRPLSLAVQPLNYQRLDPDYFSSSNEDETVNVASDRSNKRHPNMTSQESIGNCSLDVDRSASDRSGSDIETKQTNISLKILRIIDRAQLFV